MNEIFTTWGGWAVALLLGIMQGAFSIFGKRQTVEQSMIKTLSDKVDALDEKVDELRAEIRARDDYIFTLRRWIADEKPPPPPPWPEGLT